MISSWRSSRVLRFVSSLPLTVVGLALLLVLVIWGTLYQAEHGLYDAQQRFFQSWFFLAGGFLPLPGMMTVGALLFLNLLGALILRLGWDLRRFGLVLVHIGLLCFLGGGFYTARFASESFVTLWEGESTSVSTAAREWELAVWRDIGGRRRVSVIAASALYAGAEVAFPALAARVQIAAFHENCRPSADGADVYAVPPAGEGEEAIPGGRFTVLHAGGSAAIVLTGREAAPRTFTIGEAAFSAGLRRKTFRLPLTLKLLSFEKRTYPGSDIPRSFESRLEIHGDGPAREVRISMNKPLRFRDYTFYQSSFDEQDGREASTLSVVRNSGRYLPYISSAVTFLGLAWHFLVMLAAHLRRQNRQE